MPSPALPARVGSLRTPAARMTGVARRKANRAACSWSGPRQRPVTMVMPERLMPANSARICELPIWRASRVVTVSASSASARSASAGAAARPPARSAAAPGGRGAPRRGGGGGRAPRACGGARGRAGGPPPESLSRQQDEAVDGEEDGGSERLGEEDPELMLKRQTGDPHRDSCDDDQPAKPLVAGLNPSGPQSAEHAGDDADPVAPVEDKQRNGGGHMQADDE